jgi:hypothetical protein
VRVGILALKGQEEVMDTDDPCPHDGREHIGYVLSGDLHGTGPHCSVYCCGRSECVEREQMYVSRYTGLPANDLVPFRRNGGGT